MDNAQLISQLKVLLASTFSLYLKAHNYHWNVMGSNFAQNHEFFGDFYTEIWNSIDTTAEEIRKLGSLAPGSLSRYQELSRIEDEEFFPETALMFSRLYADNGLILTMLYDIRKIADESQQFGTVNYLEDRISAHEKHAWMLKSFVSS